MRVALLADPHIAADRDRIHNGQNVADNLVRTVEAVKGRNPSMVLIAGDLAWQTGSPGDYERFTELLQPLARHVMVCLTIGNHDERRNFLAAVSPRSLENGAVPQKSIVVIEHPLLRIVMLDSLFRSDVVAGLLGKQQRDWLESFLSEADGRPTVLCVHHPLHDSDAALLDADRLLRIAGPHRQVKAILHGHDHRYNHAVWEGIHVVGLPAVGMPLDAAEPLGWVEGWFSNEGVDLTFFGVEGRTELASSPRKLEWR